MPRFSGEEGFSIIVVIVMMLLIAVMGQVLISLVGTENFSTVNQMRTSQTHYIAEAVVEKAKTAIANGTACTALTYNDTLGAGSYATTGTLYNPAPTALSAAVVAGDAIIPLVSIAGYAPNGRVTIEAEEIDYGRSSNLPADCAPFAQPCLTGAQRGVNGTAPAAHALGVAVSQNQCLIRSTGTVAGAPEIAQRVIEAGVAQGGGVSSTVQSGTATSTANGTLTVPIPTAVVMNRSFLIFGTRHNSNRPVGSMVRGQIATPTTMEFVRVTNEAVPVPITISWYVVEFASGVNVQRGELNQNGATNNVAIAPVASLSQAFVTWSKTPANTDTDWGDNDPILGELTTPNNLQFRANAAYPAHIISWQVIEFTNPADILVQKGSIFTMTGNTLSVNANLPIPVDVNKTFVLVGYRTGGIGADVGRRMLRAQLIDSTTILIDRGIAAASDPITEIVWQAVQLNKTVVQRGSENFPAAGNNQIVVTLDGTVREVDAGAISIAGAQAGFTASNTNTGTDTAISTNIATTAANAWVIDVVGSDNGGSFTPGGGQVERWDVSDGRSTGASSTRTVPLPGNPTMTQTHNNASGLVHALAAIAPDPGAGTITYDTQSSNFARNVNTLSWTHAIGGGSNRKLVVGVVTEENSGTSLDEDVINVTYNGIPLTFVTQVRRFAGGVALQVEIWYMDEANLPSSPTTRIVPIATVDPTRAIAFASVQPAGGQNMGRSPYAGDDVIGVGSVTMALGPNQIVMQRDNVADTTDIGWFVVEFGQGRGGTIDWSEIF